MKCLKKVLSVILATMSLATAVAVPGMASSRTENFVVYLGGGSMVSSGSAKKESAGSMYVYVMERPGTSCEWVQGTEIVNVRGRSSSGSTMVTQLGQTAYAGSKYLSYLAGYGLTGNYYKLAVQYDDDNPYQYLDLQCKWIP